MEREIEKLKSCKDKIHIKQGLRKIINLCDKNNNLNQFTTFIFQIVHLLQQIEKAESEHHTKQELQEEAD